MKNGNKPYWIQPDFIASHSFNPQVVVIKLGTNDSKAVNWDKKEEFLNDYLSLIKSYQDLESKPTVYICRPVPVYGGGKWGITDEVVKNEIIPLIDSVAKKANVSLIDLYAALSGKPELFPDQVHPNAEGAKLIAEAVFSAIRLKP